MADSEFEEFRRTFEKLPQHFKAIPSPFYSLVPGLDEEYPSSKSDSSDQEDDKSSSDISEIQPKNHPLHSQAKLVGAGAATATTTSALSILCSNDCGVEGGGGGGGKYEVNGCGGVNGLDMDTASMDSQPNSIVQTSTGIQQTGGCMERKRRKLPEIPKVRKPLVFPFQTINQAPPTHHSGVTSLADEMGGCGRPMNFATSFPQRTFLTLKCGYLLDEDSSPDSERLHSLGDVDSGHSTSHSPNDFKSMSPQMASSPTSPFPPPFGGVPMSQIEMLEATHRGLHKFNPRHHDEIELEIGDPIYVQKEAEDLWCEGVNLRTGRQGIFPSAYAVDLDYNDFDPSTAQPKRERYLLGYLGSVETIAHKGTGVVCQAVKKITEEYGDSPKAQPCILEVSDQGLRMVDRSKPQNKRDKGACIDYFYSLKNVSFCAFHPRDHRYIGFITKHPTVQRFACHVFRGHESTRPVAEAVGRAFHRFYQKFIETAYPIEDIYIE